MADSFGDLLQFKCEDYAPIYLYTLSYSKMIYDVSSHFTMGFEVDIAKHSGIQKNGKIGSLWLFGFPQLLPDNDFLDFDIIYGIGVSDALGKPVFEDGPSDDPSKRYNFQSFLILDFDFYLVRYPHTSFLSYPSSFWCLGNIYGRKSDYKFCGIWHQVVILKC